MNSKKQKPHQHIIKKTCQHVPSPRTCPTSTRPSSPATAARAVLSLEYCTKAQPLCTEQPTILPYLAKMVSTSALVTSSVFRFPMKTRELRERGSFLLVMLLQAIKLEMGDQLQTGVLKEKLINKSCDFCPSPQLCRTMKIEQKCC